MHARGGFGVTFIGDECGIIWKTVVVIMYGWQVMQNKLKIEWRANVVNRVLLCIFLKGWDWN